VEHTIETTVNPDGSGVRVEHMEVSENSDVKLEPRQFATMVGVNEGNGWIHSAQVDSDNDTIHTFDRETRMGQLSDWSRLNGTVKIDGTIHATETTAMGYVKLQNVRFYNAVRMRMSTDSEGPTSITYRETFTWDQAVDAVVEFLMKDLDDELVMRFPELSPSERGQVVGFARARFWIAVEKGLLSGDGEEEQILREVAETTLTQSLEIIRMRYPGVEESLLERILEDKLVDFEDNLVLFLEERLPGINLALNSEIVYRLHMPGTVTDNNAHRREDGVLVWEFGPADALYTPIEIFAESRVRR
jgi:hypothetical protein